VSMRTRGIAKPAGRRVLWCRCCWVPRRWCFVELTAG
jgi:hypothetical protein